MNTTTTYQQQAEAFLKKSGVKMTTQEKFLQQWIDSGKREFTDPAEYNWCLEGAIDRKDKALILEIYDKDMISWEEEDSLADEMDELVDMANNILYS